MLTRRSLLASSAAWPLLACQPSTALPWEGGWVGAQHERGHLLRQTGAAAHHQHLGESAPVVQRRAQVLVVGGGVAGLNCARVLSEAGVDDVQLIELEDQPGGNSRGHRIAGMACPLGAHYLPVPAAHNTALLGWLQTQGLCQWQQGRWVFDERHLCHSPQERLYVDGAWHDGLLPVAGQSAQTLAEYRRFAALVAQAGREAGFALPSSTVAWTSAHAALDGQTFAAWLDAQGLRSPALRTYLHYCCEDDYGAGPAQVSAWAGLHYFASRHGFHAPGEVSEEREAVLTWPEGNAWLSQRLAAPLGERVRSGCVALRVSEARHGVVVDVWHAAQARLERWTAAQVVLATPLFVAARLLRTPPPALAHAVAAMRYAPWLVANVHLDAALAEAPGAPRAWDNVIHGSPWLGYVDAMHQRTRPHAGPTVLTVYGALGGDSAAQLRENRTRLLQSHWQPWAQAVVADLAVPHPDLPAKVRRVDVMRYGHAMSIPLPGVRSSAALAALAAPPSNRGRVHFAHSDLSGYSVFEEAFSRGQAAAQQVRRQRG